MKRNLSSQAIRAMAIGMAVAMGSSTAISGVVRGTVVNAYAATGNHASAVSASMTQDKDGQITLTLSKSGETGSFALDGDSGSGINDTTGITITNSDASNALFEGGNSKGTLSVDNSDKTNLKLTIPKSDLTTTDFSDKETNDLTITFNTDKVKFDPDNDDASSAVKLDVADLDISGNLDLKNPTINTGTAVTSDTPNTVITFQASEDLEAKESVDGFKIFKSDNTEITGKTITAKTIEGSGSNGKIEITINEELADGNYYIKYTPGTNRVTDKAGNELAAINGTTNTFEVTSEEEATTPAIETGSATYSTENGNHYVTFEVDKDLEVVSNTQVTGTPFTITAPAGQGREGVTVTHYEVKTGATTKVVLTLSGAIDKAGYTLAYDGTIAALKHTTDGALAGFSNEAIKTTPAPSEFGVQTAVIENGKANELVLTFNEKIKAEAEPKATDFTVTVDKKANVVKSLSKIGTTAEKNTLTLTLTDAVKEGQKVTVTYNPTSEIKSATDDVLAKFENKAVTNNVKNEVVGNTFVATVQGIGTYTFTKIGNTNNVQLEKFDTATAKSSATPVNNFKNGKFTVGNVEYTLTKIGNGKDKLDTISTKALEGHTLNVTEIASSAFEGNKTVTTLAFPKVEKVGANAFSGAEKLTNIDLGSATTGIINVDKNAFDASNKPQVVTNKESQDTIGQIVGNENVTTVENSNPSNADIISGKYYQTTTGLTFRGIGTNNTKTNSLEFIGKEEPKGAANPDGTENNPYIVTYDNGVVTLVKGEVTPPPTVIDTVNVKLDNSQLTFKIGANNEATLTAATTTTQSRAGITTTGTLKNGVVTAEGQKFNFTTIGDGTKALDTKFDPSILNENLQNIAKISAKAFEGNTTTGTLNLGDNVVEVEQGAFTGAENIKVESSNQATIDNVINGGLDAGKVETPEQQKFVKKAIVEKGKANEIKLTLNANLTEDLTDATGFTVKVTKNGQSVENSITGLDETNKGSNGTIILTLENDIEAGQKVELTYTGNDILPFENKEVTNGLNEENKAPEFVSAKATEARKIVLTMSEEVFAETPPAAEDFTLTGGTNSPQVQSVAIASSAGNATNQITLNLTADVTASDEDITVAYTKGQNVIKDKGNPAKELESFSAKPVGKLEEETEEKTTITIDTATVSEDGTTITLNVSSDHTLKEGSLTKTDFKIAVGSDETTYTVKTATAADKTITLELDKKLNSELENVKVKYDGESLTLADETTKATFDETAVTNNTKDHNKNVTAAIAEGAATTIKITGVSEATFTTTGVTAGDFKVTAKSKDGSQTRDVTVNNVSDATDNSGAFFELTLTGDTIQVGDIVTVSYVGTGTNAKIKITSAGSEEDLVLTDKTVDNGLTGGGAYSAPMAMSARAVAQQPQTDITGDVTTINVENAPKTAEQLQAIRDMLTNKLTHIKKLVLDGNTTLNFSKVNVKGLTIDKGAIIGGTLDITGLGYQDKVALANKLLRAGVSNVTIGGDKPQTIIDNDNNYRPPYDNNNGSSSGGSSSGSSGGGANIGNVTDGNTENNNNNNSNNSGNNNQGSENKQLTFDVIKLPSINGEPKVFGDVPASHWAKTYIDKLSTAGIINGANGNFMPNGQTKRADVTIMLVNLLGLTPEANSKFADVNASAYYAPYVGAASSYGIVNGSNGMFNPEGIISRQDTMVMIAQILKGLNLSVNTDASSLGQFSDLGSVSNYAQESVAILVNSGIITGNNGKLNPKAPVTRAEMATIMSKLYDVLAAAK